MSWYREDEFLKPKAGANYVPAKPGNVGGVKPPASLAGPIEPAIRETFSTDPMMEQRNDSAKGNDTPNPVATDADMKEDTLYAPGRQEDGEFQGEPGIYDCEDGGYKNLFGPGIAEEAAE